MSADTPDTATPVVAVLEPGYADYASERDALAFCAARVVPVGAGEDALARVTALSPQALLVRERQVDERLLAACPQLKVVVRYGVGVDNIDLDGARRRKVAVANVPDYGAEQEVSDHAVALYLAVARRVVSRDRQVRQGQWGIGQREIVHGHRRATLGVIGYGRIARQTVARFRALGFARVLACDPHLPPGQAGDEGVVGCDADTVCAEADVVTLHAPLNAGSRHILDARRIALMKPSAIVVNVSRGGLIDEPALAAALREGRVFGAGLDVFEHEPPAPDHPLLHTPNTVLSDHTAWYSEASVAALQRLAAEEVARVFRGERPRNWLNPW